MFYHYVNLASQLGTVPGDLKPNQIVLFWKTFSSTCHTVIFSWMKTNISDQVSLIVTYMVKQLIDQIFTESSLGFNCFLWTEPWRRLHVMFYRWGGLLCFHGKLHLAVWISSRWSHPHPLDSGDSSNGSGPLLLLQPRPALSPEPALQRQDIAVQGPNLQRKRLASTDRGGVSRPGQI